MPWTYRLRRRVTDGSPWYDIVECYDGTGWTENGQAPCGESVEEVRWVLERMLAALDGAVLEDTNEKTPPTP